MIVIKWVGASVFQLCSFLFLLFYLIGILNVNFSDKNNYCAMTYMFEYPQFVHISMMDNNLFPQYGLYAYSEGRFTERARKMWFDGVPVLFLPGNSGSHMQVRSLASVALRKALSNGYESHFDYFTVSFNEELSGLYGGVLHSQTQFAAACISKILSLYKNHKYIKSVPSSVILIGHSMGGVIAKRLLAYPSTINTTNIALTLAAPLEAPIVNFDPAINDFYKLMNMEWNVYVTPYKEVIHKKVLLSFGSGPRDVLVPAGLTSSNDSFINGLATAIPGVWVSPDHICMVWCKQLVMAINRYLFDIVDTRTNQITDNYEHVRMKSQQYFMANRTTTPSATSRAGVNMNVDAFWYEDNRRIYQISRPEIDRTTYLMIRLVKFPQNRFVAIETVNVDDKNWLFGCNAKDIHSTYRYCKTASSLSEFSRWSGSATEFKRKLATINLHSVKEKYPEWTHVIVKISPTRKPITLNVDINDLASRQTVIGLPSAFSFMKEIIKETEADSLYYELILPDLNVVHDAFLLYVEPIGTCNSYHVTAELHVPWAKNHEYYHYFTHLKRSPMKLRLFKSNPNITSSDGVKITLLLDPKCTFTVSVSGTSYYRLGQLVRHYTPVLVPYVAAIVLLAARANLQNLRDHGSCISIHAALISEGVKPYYVLVFSRLAIMGIMSVPLLTILLENASWNNSELQNFTRSVLVLPAYMTALGIVNIVAAGTIAVMVFSSQLAHRMLFKIVWRGGNGLAEKVASGLQKVPLVVSAALVCAVPFSCGAAALTAGAAFYAFMISKMYEEYLEDYVYKLMAKVTSRMCRLFKKRTQEKCNVKNDEIQESNDGTENVGAIVNTECKETNLEEDKIDEDLNNINFHMMLFFMWMCVTIVNIPALLTWARNFKYTMVLKPDTSYHTGMLMSACSGIIWQMDGPRKKLKFYDAVTSLLFTMAVFLIALGPFSLSIINYGVAIMFALITLQQLLDQEEKDKSSNIASNVENTLIGETSEESVKEEQNTKEKPEPNVNNINEEEKSQNTSENEDVGNDCDVCNENRIYTLFRNLRDKFSFSND